MPTKKITKKVVTKKVTTKKKTSAKKVAKKAVRKSAVKKTTKTKPVSKSQKKELIYANNEVSFWVSDGQVLNSLLALRDALESMEKNVYQYHVERDRNDFAAWVDSVLCDGDCAKDLEKAKTTTAAKTAVARHLKSYAV